MNRIESLFTGRSRAVSRIESCGAASPRPTCSSVRMSGASDIASLASTLPLHLAALLCVALLALCVSAARAHAYDPGSNETASVATSSIAPAKTALRTNASNTGKTKALLPIAEGTYAFKPVQATSKALAVSKASSQSSSKLVVSKGTDSEAQKLYVRAESGGRCSIQIVKSGLFLTVERNAVALRKWSGSEKQLWEITGKKRLTFRNASTGNVLSLSGTPKSGHPKAICAEAGAASGQQWRLVRKPLIESGYYRLRNAQGGFLAVKNGSYGDGANVRVEKKGDLGAQCFWIHATTSSFYIANLRSFKVLDVHNDSKKSGANVIQWAPHNGKNQRWKASLDRAGRLVFKSMNSKNVLSVKGSGKKATANVVQMKANGRKSQGWRLQRVKRYSLTGSKPLDRAIAEILSEHGSLKKAYAYTVLDFSWAEPDTAYRSGRYMGDDNTVRYAKQMIRNGAGSCYCTSSLFMWLARGLGYEANVTVGYLYSRIPGVVGAHSWVEVYKDGKTYVCDPDCERGYRHRDWYMNDYDDMPVEYHFW